MRRAAVLIALIVAGVLLYLVLAGDDDPARGRGIGDGPIPEAQDDDAARERTGRRRGGDGAEEEVADEEEDTAALTSFQSSWPEIGQDRPQDPALGAITGRVLLAAARPAGEAVVDAAIDGEFVARVYAQGNGAFHLKNVEPADAISLRAVAPGYAPGGADKLVVRAGQDLNVGALYVGGVIDPNVDNRVDVRVIDADGNPVAGAAVGASTIDSGALLSLGQYEKVPGGTVLRSKTDAEGRAHFELLPPGSYDVFVEAPGFTYQVRPRFLVQHDTTAKLQFELTGGKSISGKVVDPEGQPIADAKVGVLRWGSFNVFPPTITKEDGTFEVTGLQSGNYFLFVVKEDVGGKDVQNIAAGTKDLVIDLPVAATLEVHVKDAATGEPITEFGLRPFRNVPFAYAYSPLVSVTAPDGTYKLTLPESDYGLEVTAEGYALESIASVKFPAEEPLAVEMDPAGVVHGKVVARLGGEPVRGARVFVKKGGFPPSPYKDLQTVTDADGLFTLPGLAPRTMSLWVKHVDHTEQLFEGIDPVVPAEGQALVPQEFRLGSGGRVEGRVFTADHQPEAGANMQLSAGFDIGAIRNTSVEADGTYVFKNVPPGANYTVSVGRFLPGQPGRSKSNIKIEEGATVTVDFGAEQGGVRVTGTVVDESGPVANSPVSLIAADGGSTYVQQRTDDAGAFVFEGVAPGDYQVAATGGRRRAMKVSVREGEVPEPVELVLVPSGVQGVVVDASTGEPLSGAWVECERVLDSSSGNLANLVTSYKAGRPSAADGSFEVTGLESGSYTMRLSRDGYGTELVPEFTIAEGETKTGLEVRMGPACVLTGTVKNASGVPVEGASFKVVTEGGRSLFLIDMTTSATDGVYSQGSLKPGRYKVTASKDGYAPTTLEVTVAADEPTEQDFVLLQGGRLDITVRAGGEPAKDVLLTLLDSAGKPVTKSITLENLFSTRMDRTDANGQARISGVPAGTYTLRAVRGSASARSESFEVFEATSTAVEVLLPQGTE